MTAQTPMALQWPVFHSGVRGVGEKQEPIGPPIVLPAGTFAAGRERRRDSRRRNRMTVDLVILQPIVALVAGILILLFPRLLNILVAIYLILIGILGLVPH